MSPKGMPENLPIRGVKLGGPGVEVGHDPITIDGDDGVGGDFENMAEAFGNPFPLPLRRTPLLDIAEDEDDSVQRAIIAVNGRAAVIDRDLLAIPGEKDGVVGKADHRSRAPHLFDRALHRLPGFLADDTKYLGQRLSFGVRERSIR